MSLRSENVSSRRVLIVSPRFAPSNAADSHRIRHSLPYFAEFGWEPTVLAVDAEYCDAPRDPMLERTIPDSVRVIRTSAISRRVAARLGLGAFDLRALPYLAAAGSRLLRNEKFDLIYFSTTAFSTVALGAVWLERFGVPFIIDLQDPWRNDYYRRPDAPRPPGGRLKYGLVSALARVLEPLAMRRVAHVISVSPAYPGMLMSRYHWMRPQQFTVLPFAASESDYDMLRRERLPQRVFTKGDGFEHWVYAGVAPASMGHAIRGFFKALQLARAERPERFARLRVHFVGTSYAPSDRAKVVVEPIARSCGVADLVEELPTRLPYFEVLQCLLDADALIVPGSDDPGYTASKLSPYILARRPLLAIVHSQSSVVDAMRAIRAGTLVTFDSETSSEQIAQNVLRDWFHTDREPSHVDWTAFEQYMAREMTRRQCEVFDATVPSARNP